MALQKKKRKIPVSEKKRLAKERGLKVQKNAEKALGAGKSLQAFRPIGVKLWFNVTQENSCSS